MAFTCSCFISYPHNAGKSVDAFVTRLKGELTDRFAQFVTDPIITDHDFGTGVAFNKTIAQTICESACMLVVYMPVYERKLYCLQEYTAMERLEIARYVALQQNLSAKLGMILPVVYAGDQSTIPKWISDRINYKDISKFTIAGPEVWFDQPDFKTWIVDIASMVNNLYNAFAKSPTNPCQTCGTYSLPGAQDPDVTTRLNIPKEPPESFR